MRLLNRPRFSRPHDVAHDNLAADLQRMIDKAHIEVDTAAHQLQPAGPKPKEFSANALMEQLTIYITARDHKIFDHAWHLGWERGCDKGGKGK